MENGPKLYIYDSKQSISNNVRDSFMYNLHQEIEQSPNVISEVVEMGVLD